ncbi:PadR family transcriptional regulator [Cytobacillus sp. IB215665]|uniref:PadR family transcriptional regulator n=1 Tax=Cytobacillus sp. IB215665 TaxID=3097357 RepID=UPI002A0F2FE7|nr:PadR family transcriptional regulator [Cytobacillus sp. IB215665]MDX8365350.1 PadR family transcriptional regulator [Cytobacillus sp. IB215665]
MNKAQFIVLGILEQLGKGSGYDIKHIYDQNKFYQWIDIKIGSIYHAIKQLHKEGFISEVKKLQEGNYPTKTIYTVTNDGKKKFDTLQKESFLGLFPDFYGFKLALKLNTRRTEEEINEYAQMALQIIDEKLDAMKAHLNSLEPNSHKYTYDSFFILHDQRLYEAEKEWIQEAVNNIDLIMRLEQ